MKLTLENFRAIIYYDFRRGLSRQECIDQLISIFGDEAPSYASVQRWYNELKGVSWCEARKKGDFSGCLFYAEKIA